MKNISKYISFAVIAVSLSVTGVSCATTRQPYQQTQVSISGFYDALSPYGNWTTYGSYGQVWIPNAGPDFQPYSTAGHWVYSDYGWTWVSDYDWGWAPFHYGRWAFDDAYGWMWVPGTEWGPAWVSWRNSNDYYGWAPLGPGMTIGVSMNIPVGYWSFVPCQYITSTYVNRYYVDRSHRVNVYNNTTIINNTTVINNRTYYRGPATRDVERYTRNEIRPVRVVDGNRPGRATVDRNQVSMYRPQPSALRGGRGSNTFTNGNSNDRNNSDRPVPGRTIRRNDLPDRNIDRNNDGRPDNGTPGRTIDRGNMNRPDNSTPVRPIENNNNNNIPGRTNDNRPTRPEFDRNNNRPVTPTPSTPSTPSTRPVTPSNPGNNNTFTPRPDNNSRPDRSNSRPETRPMTPTPSPGPVTRPAQPQMSRPQPQPEMSRPQPQPSQPRPQMVAPQAQPRPSQPPMQSRPQMQPSRPAPAPAPQRSAPAPAPSAPRSDRANRGGR